MNLKCIPSSFRSHTLSVLSLDADTKIRLPSGAKVKSLTTSVWSIRLSRSFPVTWKHHNLKWRTVLLFRSNALWIQIQNTKLQHVKPDFLCRNGSYSKKHVYPFRLFCIERQFPEKLVNPYTKTICLRNKARLVFW